MTLPNDIEAAGKNGLTLVAFLCYLLVSGVATFFKKDKIGVRVMMFLSVFLLIGLIVSRLLPSSQATAGANSGVVVHGNGNGTAVGNGNHVQVEPRPKDSNSMEQ
jgi:hypothetical protein